MHRPVKNIIFDLGGVLMDWNPRYLYRKIFEDTEEMEWFLANVCTSEWNEQQDAGRPFKEATSLLIEQFPKYKSEITAFDERWEETIKGSFEETVSVLETLDEEKKYKIFALTNWSGEKFPLVKNKYTFYDRFLDILVSGDEKLIKPNLEIFYLAIERFDINPASTLFIDDNLANIEAAKKVGFQVVHFKQASDITDFFNKLKD